MITEKIDQYARQIWEKKIILGRVPLGVTFSDGSRGFAVPVLDHDDVLIFLQDAPMRSYIEYLVLAAQGRFGRGVMENESAYRLDEEYLRLHFGVREMLTDREQEQEDAFLAQEERTCWPVLRRCVPYVLPMEVTQEEVLVKTEEALEQLNWFLDHGEMQEGEREKFLLRAEMPYLHRDGDSYRVTHGVAPIPKKVWPAAAVRGALATQVSALRQLPSRGEWEVTMLVESPENTMGDVELPLPAFAQGTGEEVSLLMVSHDSPDLIRPEETTVDDFASAPEHLLERLTDCMKERQEVPRVLLPADERTERLLKNWCRIAGVKLRKEKEFPMLDGLRKMYQEHSVEGMRQQLLREQKESDPQKQPLLQQLREDAPAAEHEILSRNALQLGMMGEEAYARLSLMAEFGVLSEEATEKLKSRKEPSAEGLLSMMSETFEQMGPEELADLQEEFPGTTPEEIRQMLADLQKVAHERESGKK